MNVEHLISLASKKLDFLLPGFIRKGFYQYEPRPLNIETCKVKLVCQPPRISVVIPSYNQARFLERTITSVLDQRYPNLELIVVDGGSTDCSKAIINKYKTQLHWWCSEPDIGQADAINKGFSKANGEILTWLNADDCHLPNTLARVSNCMGCRKDIDVVYGNRLLINENEQEIGKWVLPPHHDQVLSWEDFIPQESLFWRWSLWKKVGQRLDISFDFAMDWDLLLRFRDVNAKMMRIPYYLGLFRIHSQQKTSSQINQVGFEEMHKLRRRSLGYTPSQFQCAIGVSWYLLNARIFEMLSK
jgi:glycosyltransferase involved in cell wall biosynthesis